MQAERVEDKVIEQDKSLSIFSDDFKPKIIISSLIIFPMICLVGFNLYVRKGAKK